MPAYLVGVRYVFGVRPEKSRLSNRTVAVNYELPAAVAQKMVGNFEEKRYVLTRTTSHDIFEMLETLPHLIIDNFFYDYRLPLPQQTLGIRLPISSDYFFDIFVFLHHPYLPTTTLFQLSLIQKRYRTKKISNVIMKFKLPILLITFLASTAIASPTSLSLRQDDCCARTKLPPF